jgi:hypothetical protein
MGRSPFFTIDDIKIGPIKEPTINQEDQEFNLISLLSSLQNGDTIKLKFKPIEFSFLTRSISIDFSSETHGSGISDDIHYKVINNNFEPVLNKRTFDYCGSTYEFKSIALQSIMVPEKNHEFYWFLTNDGYIRECEHYTYLYIVDSIEIIEQS